MDVRVSGHQVDTGEALRELAQRRIADLTDKYFARTVGARVTFGRGPNSEFTCDILAPLAQGVVLKASHRAPKADQALGGAADRIESQLRRYVKRLRSHKAVEADQPYVENAAYTIFTGPSDAADESEEQFPTIVAETRVDVPDSSVSDAVMLMDLRNTNALMFKNSATGAFNMVYRREDGNIGWVEPQAS
ncbi:MAG: HPF/RaiA family ribosome-associated protein [Sphingomicrobium sp.]